MRRALLVVAAAALAGGVLAAPAGAQLRLVTVASGFDRPVHVASTRSEPSRVYVVEQAGVVRVVENGTVLAKPFLDIRSRVSCCGERGLLSLAFHPRYPEVRRVYVNFTNLRGTTRVVEFRVNAARTQANPSTARVLLSLAQPYPNHNGGQVLFGPKGDLFVPTGDGGSGGDPGNRAQSMQSRHGKLLRIDVKTKRVRIVALGLRNPWRTSFDAKTGRMWIADVGQSAREEVSVWRAGQSGLENYGWRRFEGTLLYDAGTPLYRPSRLVNPKHEYSHAEGCSITGGFVYRGAAIPRIQGRYFFGDYCNGRVWSFRLKNGKKTGFLSHPNLQVPGNLSSFGEGPRRQLYLVGHVNGRLYRVAGQ